MTIIIVNFTAEDRMIGQFISLFSPQQIKLRITGCLKKVYNVNQA